MKTLKKRGVMLVLGWVAVFCVLCCMFACDRVEVKDSQTTKAKDNPPYYTNSIGMEFVKIPSGSYMRGCDPNFEQCSSGEIPQQRISISSFYLGKYEVTQEQWVAVMGSNPCQYYNKGRTNPVDRVSWNDVQEFVRRLNAKEGHNRYRLPTEAEWEYACRAGSTTTYSFGDDADGLGAYAWYLGNAGDRAHPVGQLRPNAWDLYDMHGNVWEWVQDWYSEKYYSWSQEMNNPGGPNSGSHRVLRGGSGICPVCLCRSATRSVNEPDGSSDFVGFRLALTLEN